MKTVETEDINCITPIKKNLHMTLDSAANDTNNDDMDNVTSSKSKFFVKFIFLDFLLT